MRLCRGRIFQSAVAVGHFDKFVCMHIVEIQALALSLFKFHLPSMSWSSSQNNQPASQPINSLPFLPQGFILVAVGDFLQQLYSTHIHGVCYSINGQRNRLLNQLDVRAAADTTTKNERNKKKKEISYWSRCHPMIPNLCVCCRSIVVPSSFEPLQRIISLHSSTGYCRNVSCKTFQKTSK